MGSDLNITTELQQYILNHGFKLHPVQKESYSLRKPKDPDEEEA